MRRLLVPILGALMLAAGCGGAAPAPAPGSPGQPQAAAPAPQPPQHVVLRLDYLLAGHSAPFVVAKEKGYYRQAGLDVDVQEGKGSSTTAQTVGNGSDTFGLVDASTAAVLISKGVPIKVIACFVQTGLNGVIFRADEPISQPADLAGKRGGFVAGESALVLLPALEAANHLPQNAVQTVLMNPTAKAQALIDKKVDFVGGFITGDYARILAVLPSAKAIPFAKWGVNTLSMSLIAQNDYLAAHPDTVRAFVKASVQGWQYAGEHQDETVDIALKDFPQASRPVLERLKDIVGLEHTPNTQGKPLGWMAEQDWQETIDLMHRYGGLTDPKPLVDYYTNSFITDDKAPQ